MTQANLAERNGAGHILKHGKKDIFIKGSAINMDQTKEDEADQFAADFLIPRQEYNLFTKKVRKDAFRKLTSTHLHLN
jgi:Zn-dependent peptidase ImmA (M78 family)